MVHSIECARIIQDLSIFSQSDRELGMAAALLHDLGKIKTIGVNFSRPEIGKAIDHDAITLELCSGVLARLDMEHPELGIDLRHILTCRSTRRWGYEPKLAIAHAVQLADRLSSDRSLHRRPLNHGVLSSLHIAS
ncbi:MAG: HD domain-containing protein [Candidatus Sedimenticola sp. (ex Thyasira tokunagai)]